MNFLTPGRLFAKPAPQPAVSNEHQGSKTPSAGDLADQIEELRQQGLRVWPQLKVSSEEFSAYMLRQVSNGRTPPSLTNLRAGELVLACACALGQSQAIAAFTERYRSDVRAILARLGTSAGAAHDAEQKVWIRLFVAQGSKAPKIAEYSGRGNLRAWVRTLAVRTVLNDRSAVTEGPIELKLAKALMAPGSSPELEYFKRVYHAEFQEAFVAARQSLSPRERSTLSQYFIDELTIDQLGALHGVHRATAARQVHNACARLLKETRRILGERLEISEEQLDSIIQLIKSRMEIPSSHS